MLSRFLSLSLSYRRRCSMYQAHVVPPLASPFYFEGRALGDSIRHRIGCSCFTNWILQDCWRTMNHPVASLRLFFQLDCDLWLPSSVNIFFFLMGFAELFSLRFYRYQIYTRSELSECAGKIVQLTIFSIFRTLLHIVFTIFSFCLHDKLPLWRIVFTFFCE